jgi:protein-S-isoprenylcysteine O-methyltransferase Ste14
MPTVARTFPILPALTFFWMMMRAGLVFTPDVGRRDVRGLGIMFSMWATVGATTLGRTPPPWMQLIGAAGLLLSLALYEWAAWSIRDRVFSYAGNHDVPQFVHRSGPYAYVRNPFYLSYLLAEISTAVMWPGVLGALIIVLAVAYFQWLTRFEERKFADSPVAAEYAGYAANTGRLLPRLTRRR